MTYDLIGTIQEPTGVMLTDTEGNEYPEMRPVEGYHVNMLDTDEVADKIAPYIITVSTLVRVFAGRDDTVQLKFKDRDEWMSLGIEVVEEEV